MHTQTIHAQHQTIHTLQKDGYVRKTSKDSFLVSLDHPIPLDGLGGGITFTERTRSSKTGWIDVRRDGDDLFIRGMELDMLLEAQREHTYRRHDAMFERFMHPQHLTHDLGDYLHLPPNVVITLYHLRDFNFIPDRYFLDVEGLSMRICSKEGAFRNSPGEAFWLMLCAEDRHWEIGRHPAPPEMLSTEWIKIVR